MLVVDSLRVCVRFWFCCSLISCSVFSGSRKPYFLPWMTCRKYAIPEVDEMGLDMRVGVLHLPSCRRVCCGEVEMSRQLFCVERSKKCHWSFSMSRQTARDTERSLNLTCRNLKVIFTVYFISPECVGVDLWTCHLNVNLWSRGKEEEQYQGR